MTNKSVMTIISVNKISVCLSVTFYSLNAHLREVVGVKIIYIVKIDISKHLKPLTVTGAVVQLCHVWLDRVTK